MIDSFSVCLNWRVDVWGFEGVDVWGCEKKVWRKWGCLDCGMLGWMCEESLWEFVSDVIVVSFFFFFLKCKI